MFAGNSGLLFYSYDIESTDSTQNWTYRVAVITILTAMIGGTVLVAIVAISGNRCRFIAKVPMTINNRDTIHTTNGTDCTFSDSQNHIERRE